MLYATGPQTSYILKGYLTLTGPFKLEKRGIAERKLHKVFLMICSPKNTRDVLRGNEEFTFQKKMRESIGLMSYNDETDCAQGMWLCSKVWFSRSTFNELAIYTRGSRAPIADGCGRALFKNNVQDLTSARVYTGHTASYVPNLEKMSINQYLLRILVRTRFHLSNIPLVLSPTLFGA